jgi:hypothetical protein
MILFNFVEDSWVGESTFSAFWERIEEAEALFPFAGVIAMLLSGSYSEEAERSC